MNKLTEVLLVAIVFTAAFVTIVAALHLVGLLK